MTHDSSLYPRAARLDRRPFLFAAVLASCALLIPQATKAQLPERLQRCLPYPTFAEEIADMTPPAPEKQYVLDEVHFDGDTQLTQGDLAKVAESLKPGSSFSEPDFYETVAEVARGEWLDRGYFRAEVTASSEMLSHEPTADHYVVILHVKAGRQYRTGDIRFVNDEGHTAIPLDELRTLVPLQKGDPFATDKLREAFNAMHKRYGEAGYMDFTSDPQFEIDEENGVINLTLGLNEGKQFRVATVEVLGVDPKTESELRSAAPIGEPFNSEKIEAVINVNRSKLPEGAGLKDVNIRRNWKNGTISVSFNFWSCQLATK
jgi:outer membrane protein assembly factor BamA